MDAIAQEAPRVGLPASCNNALLRSVYSHLNNGKHADCVVTGGYSLRLKDDVDRIRIAHAKHLVDVQIACPATTNDVWIRKSRSANGVDSFVTEIEAEKYGKHETP